MKKIFLAGALAASMLISSSAFAADLTASYADGKVSVDTSFITTEMINAGKQMTVVVLDGNGSTVSTDTIRYIDQETAAADIFQAMGMLVRTGETAIPDGDYTVKVGGDDITDLYVGKFTVGEQGTKVTLYVGDVNGDKTVDTTDGMAIITRAVGGPNNVGGTYDIGSEPVTGFVIGDVNSDKTTDTTDGMAIITRAVGGPNNVGGTYDIGASVEVIIK